MKEGMSEEQMRSIYSQEKNFEEERKFDEEFEVTMLTPGTGINVETNRTKYKIEIREDGVYISGHPIHCPEPIKAEIASFETTEGVEGIKPNIIKKNWRLLYAPEGGRPVQAGHIQKFELIPRV